MIFLLIAEDKGFTMSQYTSKFYSNGFDKKISELLKIEVEKKPNLQVFYIQIHLKTIIVLIA